MSKSNIPGDVRQDQIDGNLGDPEFASAEQEEEGTAADEATELLRAALGVLMDIANSAGDVAEWNQGGDYYEVSSAIRSYLNEKG